MSKQIDDLIKRVGQLETNNQIRIGSHLFGSHYILICKAVEMILDHLDLQYKPKECTKAKLIKPEKAIETKHGR